HNTNQPAPAATTREAAPQRTTERHPCVTSRRLRYRGGPREPLLDDRPVQQGRDEAERDREPPHHVVVALQVEQAPAAPAAEEAADLVAEEDDAVQHGEMDRPEEEADKRR